MRKYLRKIFWSHGTPLGYLGSLSRKGRSKIFSKWVLINLSNPLGHPEPLVDPLLTKNLDRAGPWCEIFRPGIPFRPLDEQALNDSYVLTHRLMQVQGDYAVGGTLFVISSLCPVVSKLRQDRNQILKVRIPHHDFL